ncbi:hypothetical protein BT93_D2223 [Corymbia citriodora subsp. variegata]|nr:hypothetical protein BT93_D2223 [Corymbia citriodora subsp. variegata]
MTMSSEFENLWLFAIASKCRAFTHDNIVWSLLLLGLTWLAISLLHWSHPGGPAWGKYFWRKALFFSPSSSSLSLSHTIPGPRGLPLFGSMSLMLHLAHHRVAAAAEAFGAKRLMAFSLGNSRVIVTCNPEVAKEILNSPVFADRPVRESAYRLMFNRSIGFARHDVYWRTLRRIATTHLFAPNKIKAFESKRRFVASQMVTTLFTYHEQPFTVRQVLKRASLNHMMSCVFGQSYDLNCTSREVEELTELVEEGYELLGMLNWSDHLPWMAELDPQRIKFRCSRLVPKVNSFVSRIIAEHRAQPPADQQDFVDVLLSLQGSDKLPDSDIIAVLWEMIFRGTDTVAVLMEWILARMVVHPEIQGRVQEEMDQVVGRPREVNESDIGDLPYLQAVVKEVLRLHPPGPLLSWARLAITDTTVDGHHVPAGTTAMVNMWAICRDPLVWPDPLLFRPDRFLGEGTEFSVLGSDLRLAPFGSGKRACPGKMLGLTTVTYWVAAMLQEYDWRAAVSEDKVDLSEFLRLSCEMANPLAVRLRPRRVPSQTSAEMETQLS